MAYTYVVLGVLATMTGLSGLYYYSLLTPYVDENNLYQLSEVYDGERYARIYRNGDECGALRWNATTRPERARKVTKVSYDEIISKCKRNPLHRHPFRSMKMWPGTKWCGRGNMAEKESDLGTDVALDTCCRDHDHCPLVIHGRIKKFGLKNPRFYTSSHCSCDDRLYDCLKRVDTRSSRIVGQIYFNYLRVECFNEYVGIGKDGKEQYLVRLENRPRF